MKKKFRLARGEIKQGKRAKEQRAIQESWGGKLTRRKPKELLTISTELKSLRNAERHLLGLEYQEPLFACPTFSIVQVDEN